MRADAVLFDKDGTLFDFQRTWAPWLDDVISDLGGGDAELTRALDRAWGYDRAVGIIRPDSVVVAGEVQDLAAHVAPLLPDMKVAEILEYLLETSVLAEPFEVIPLVEFLGGLAASGLGLGVATNDAEQVARAQLSRVGAEALLPFIAGYDTGHGGKPGTGMLNAFAEHAATPPARVVMVGDSTHDLEAGRAAGMQTVAVLTGVAKAPALAPLADAVLPDIGHLPAWLEG